MQQNDLFKKGNEQRMTSLEIAEVTGKQHKNVMQAIRNMEPAWEKVQGLKFQLSSRIYNLPNGGKKEVPCYSLTKTECLYVATKFNDEARAKLVLRWEQLEMERLVQPMTDMEIMAKAVLISAKQIEELTNTVVELAPKAEYCDEVLDSVSCMTTTQVAKELDMSAIELNRWLCELGIQYGQSGQYLLYADYARRGFAKNRTYSYRDSNGELHTRTYLVWTERGREFIHKHIKKL